MDCITAQKLISDYSVGLVHGRQSADLTAHLSSCPACRAELDKLEQIMLFVEDIKSVEPPADLWAGVCSRIAQETKQEERKSLWQTLPGLFRSSAPRWSVGFATAVLAGILAFARVHDPASDAGYSAGDYVQGHVIYATQDFLADQAALSSEVALNDREQSGIGVL